MSSQTASNHSNGSDIKVLEQLPAQTRSKNMFDCFYPGVEPTIKNVQESAPLPTSIMEAFSHAVKYIEQGASTIRTIEQEYEILQKRYQAAEEKIQGDYVKLGKFREQIESQNSRLTELEDNLAVKERLALRLARKINNLRNGEQSGDDAATPELMEIQEKLELATSRGRDAKERYEAAEKENIDLRNQLALENHNSACLGRDKERLETFLANKEQDLLSLRTKYAQVSVEFEEARHHIDVDGHIISGIQDERETLAKVIHEKTEEIDHIKSVWKTARKTWKAQLDETRNKLEQVEDEKGVVEGNLQRCEQSLRSAEEVLKSLKEEHRNCETKLRNAEERKRIIEEEHRSCASRLKSAEEAKKLWEEKEASLEAQLKEAKKPKLENDLTLGDPIAIAGSLSGADEDIDDKCWKILTLPFAVSIYGHSTKDLFVTDNGTISLDKAIDNPRERRMAMELPCREIPTFTLLPFWTDLMIAKGKPHGIFYQISGRPGTRMLTIEWYVTHYDNTKLYYQFNATLEEARPDVATFRYYQVQDKGKNSAVGVQGHPKALTYSYQEKKIVPGLQLVFDTKNGRIQSSNFEVKKK